MINVFFPEPWTLTLCVMCLSIYDSSCQLNSQENSIYNNVSLSDIPNQDCFSCKNFENESEEIRYIGCYCDADCFRYGDCCPEIAFGNTTRKDDLSTRWTCNPLMDNFFAFMIGDCPSTYVHQDIIKLCKRNVDLYTYLLDIPVVSLSTNITYINKYCAICNDDLTLADLTITFTCSSYDALNLSLINLRNFEYIPKIQIWEKNVPDDTQLTMKCALKIQEFFPVSNYRHKYGGRTCPGNLKTTCDENWKDSTDRELCEKYALYEYNDELFFKNAYCAKCSGYGNQTKCGPRIRGLVPKHPMPVPFSLVFNFRDLEKMERSERCHSGKIFDPITDSCVSFFCKPTFKLVNGYCVSTTINSTLEHDCHRIYVSPENYNLLENGSILITSKNKLYIPGEFESSSDGKILICAEQKPEVHFTFSDGQSYLSIFCLALSILCLLLHMLLYVLVPKWRNVPGKSLFSLSVALLMGQLLFLVGSNQSSIKSICQAMGVLIHFFFLAAFFWMNAMSFDIFRTFTSNTHRTDSLRVTFRKYCLYAWGCPILVVTTAFALDYIPEVPSTLRPQYGEYVCWINHSQALIYFFILPIGCIVIANTIFFAMTVLAIRGQSKEAEYAQKRSESVRVLDDNNRPEKKSGNRATDKIKLFLYVKLAILMGLTWIFGFIASLADVPSLWYPFIVLNGCQGALIFISFDLKWKVLQNFMEAIRIKRRKRSQGGTTCATSRATSSTRTSNTTAPAFPSKVLVQNPPPLKHH